MMERIEEGLHAMGCPKINVQVRKTNAGVVAFYQSLGYAEDNVTSLGKRLEDDEQPA